MEKQHFKIKNNNFNVDTITNIVSICSQYKSDIYFSCNNNQADAKSLINLISLNLSSASSFEISFVGQDGYLAFEQLKKYLVQKEII